MSSRGLMALSLISGALAILIFIMVISAYAGSRGGATVATAQTQQRGQPVDTEIVYGAPQGVAPSAPGPTVAPVTPPVQGNAGSQQTQAVEAPPASAPPNPFTAGIH